MMEEAIGITYTDPFLLRLLRITTMTLIIGTIRVMTSGIGLSIFSNRMLEPAVPWEALHDGELPMVARSILPSTLSAYK